MGAILSRFRGQELAAKVKKLVRKKTTLEILENLESRIKSIEENKLSTEQRQRKIVGQLLLVSVGIYVIAALVFYFACFPAPLQEQIFYIIPLLIFPIIVIFVKRLVTWYYRRKLTRNQDKLHNMIEEKKRLLDDVMDKETYKVAKEILEKFAPEQLRKSSSLVLPIKTVATPDPSLQRRVTTTSVPTSNINLAPISTPGTDLRRRSVGVPPQIQGHGATPGQTNGQGFMQRPLGPPMPRPILPRERSYLDKLVEYLVGDGPSNRYALICKNCESHNGMALKEEFEYFAFRCCYCFYLNPARKQRPQAPRLPSSSSGADNLLGRLSVSELESASDSEEESGSDQLTEQESVTKEDGVKISEIGTEDLAENSGLNEPSNTQTAENGKSLDENPSPSTDSVPKSPESPKSPDDST
ncbi:hypothetical protein L9F63_022767 [Diploptera punctata]|uniref:Endoplasmic reticulum junction formation protein lunapark n=1 Tax=Diploptera punctata TaxID=6984 RepID=A0AAD7ZLU6_DIPPU|nr:hypothetical protein L9F63_022767 [Diploptera punctata]